MSGRYSNTITKKDKGRALCGRNHYRGSRSNHRLIGDPGRRSSLPAGNKSRVGYSWQSRVDFKKSPSSRLSVTSSDIIRQVRMSAPACRFGRSGLGHKKGPKSEPFGPCIGGRSSKSRADFASASIFIVERHRPRPRIWSYASWPRPFFRRDDFIGHSFESPGPVGHIACVAHHKNKVSSAGRVTRPPALGTLITLICGITQRRGILFWKTDV